MPNYSKLVIETVFETVWETWLNKDGESSALKAVNVFLKSETKETLIKVCEAYILDNSNADPSFTYKLSNFLNQDHWRDVLEYVDIEKLQKKRDEAIEIINEWNAVCANHWCKADDIETKIPMVVKALHNQPFKQNWRKALGIAKLLFKYSFRDGDYRQKLILSLRWFTSIAPEKHTVMKIIEGEFGKPSKEYEVKNHVGQPIDHAARNKAAEELKAMFPEVRFEKKVEVKEKPELKTIEVSEEAIKIAELIKTTKPKHKPENEVDKIANKITQQITNRTCEEGKGDDPFSLF